MVIGPKTPRLLFSLLSGTLCPSSALTTRWYAPAGIDGAIPASPVNVPAGPAFAQNVSGLTTTGAAVVIPWVTRASEWQHTRGERRPGRWPPAPLMPWRKARRANREIRRVDRRGHFQ
jgi:hypothetical protein